LWKCAQQGVFASRGPFRLGKYRIAGSQDFARHRAAFTGKPMGMSRGFFYAYDPQEIVKIREKKLSV